MSYPHRHRVIATVDVANEHGAIMRVRLIENWPRTRWWLTRGYVEADDKVRFVPYPYAYISTSSVKVRDEWIAKLKDLAWDDAPFTRARMNQRQRRAV